MKPCEWKRQGGFLEIDGRRIFYRTSAPSPEVILLLHGFPTASYDYHRVWDRLSAKWPLLAFDMIGYGFSDKPPELGYTTFDQADFLEAVLERLGVRRVHLLTHDYGNTITQELLARRGEGERGYAIESICFLNGALFPETHRPILAQKLLISPLGALFGRFVPASRFKSSLASVFGEDTRPTDEELDDIIGLFWHNGGNRIAHRLIRYMTERARYRDRWVGALSTIDVPFRFINGLSDPVSGAHLVSRFRELFPEYDDIVELPSIGHFPHLEAPDEVVRHYAEFMGR